MVNINENSRLGAVLFYSYWANRESQRASEYFQTFCDQEHWRYSLWHLDNVARLAGGGETGLSE